MISADMMERLHAGDSTGVLEILGMQTKSAEEVILAVTESTRKELEAMKHLYEYKKTTEYSSEIARRKALEQVEDKMARLQSRIEAIEARLKNTAEETCPICYCEVATPSLTPCCRNLFCFACICQVLKHSSVCPLCREIIYDIQTIQVLGAQPSDGVTQPQIAPTKPKTKQETFRDFLQNNPQAKVLMFSSYDATFQGLSSMLETERIPHTTLNGSQARISKVIGDFEKGKYRVLFLNARNMGAGLNITPATHVVLYHKMPIETQNQIIGRAMRMGRKDPLTVLHLLHGNEMEFGSEENQIEHV
jgi:SNF2 family DNA or RNA helicase